MERSPLWPARPPPALTRTVPSGRSSSSCTIDQPGQILDPEAADEGGDGAARVVHVGLREGQRQAAALDPGLGTRACSLERLRRSPWRAASEDHGVGAGVVAGAGVLGPGVAEADGQQVRGRARRALIRRGESGIARAASPPRERTRRRRPGRTQHHPPGLRLRDLLLPAVPPSASASASAASARSNSMAARLMEARTTSSSGVTSVVTPGGQVEIADADRCRRRSARRCRPPGWRGSGPGWR